MIPKLITPFPPANNKSPLPKKFTNFTLLKMHFPRIHPIITWPMKRLIPSLLLLSLLAADAPKEVTLLGYIDYKPCTESSGVLASRKHPGVFWTHCDSGNDAAIYAITRVGKFIAEYQFDVPNHDWEDIAIDDDGPLFIGDIGNNGGKRAQIHVHR